MNLKKVTYLMPNPDRSTYIGTTDVASLFGLSPYPDRTYLRLWREKAGLVDREDLSGRDDIEFGKRMEDLVCGWVCEREGWERLPKQFLGNYLSPEYCQDDRCLLSLYAKPGDCRRPGA